MQAGFFKRFCAYIIDIFILNMIISLVTINLNINNKYNEEIIDLTSKYTNNEIAYNEMLEEYTKLTYQNHEDNYIYFSIECIITIGYFIVFQALNKGQTIGKKLLKIKVLNNDDSEVKLKGILLRSLFLYNTLSLSLTFLAIKYLNEHIYSNIYTILTVLETLFMITTLMFIIYRKDKRGLHDIIAKTKVVSE